MTSSKRMTARSLLVALPMMAMLIFLLGGCMTMQAKHVLAYEGAAKQDAEVGVLYVPGGFLLKEVDGVKVTTTFGRLDLLPGEHKLVGAQWQSQQISSGYVFILSQKTLNLSLNVQAGKQYELVYGQVRLWYDGVSGQFLCKEIQPLPAFTMWGPAAAQDSHFLDASNAVVGIGQGNYFPPNLAAHTVRRAEENHVAESVIVDLSNGQFPAWWTAVSAKARESRLKQ